MMFRVPSLSGRSAFRALIGLALLLVLGSAARSLIVSGAEPSCPDTPANLPAARLDHARAALAAGQPLVIVTLGSSSTQSWMSSDAAHSYPAQLQATLNDALPQTHVAVLNRGIGGQDAVEEVARIEKDVIAVRPQIVIWQVGANGVLRGSDPAEFARLVAGGVRRMQDAGIDVVLMDNQRAPKLLAAEHGSDRIDPALASVAADTGASLFSRGQLMDEWAATGHPYGEFISGDGLHHNNLGYRCVARALAGTLLAGLDAPAAGKDGAASPSPAPRS
jgi:lysophospholipase L1-like esterase